MIQLLLVIDCACGTAAVAFKGMAAAAGSSAIPVATVSSSGATASAPAAYSSLNFWGLVHTYSSRVRAGVWLWHLHVDPFTPKDRESPTAASAVAGLQNPGSNLTAANSEFTFPSWSATT